MFPHRKMKLGAVLLVGGESRRMGCDKSTLRLNGEPLWRTQLKLLQRLDPVEIFISGRTDPAWRPIEVEFVADRRPPRGPISGLAATLERLTGSHLLALAVDMPFMTEMILGQICARVKPGRGVLPMIGERAEPLAAIYPKDVRSEFSVALNGDDYSLQIFTRGLVAAHKLEVFQVAADEERFFRNLNRPADISQLSSA